MSSRLSDIFGELGISQHLDAFVDQGFDTWETILDITESDLDALGVKLGHRRKLQRRIANARGIPANAVLAPPTKPSVEDMRNEASKPEVPASALTEARDAGVPVVQKRKYRRHPKPDENAPERPPSAYVLFSNKMRDDLKGQNLTFTEIAKLVGENWQGLTQAEKEPYERQAQAAKDKYNHDLAEYKQTPGYKKYLQYLQDFKAKHAVSSDKDPCSAKRARTLGPGVAKHSGCLIQEAGKAGILGEAHCDSPPARRQRLDSLVSSGDSYYDPAALSASMRTPTEESSGASPSRGYFDRRELSPVFSASPTGSPAPPTVLAMRRDPSYAEGHRNDGPRNDGPRNDGPESSSQHLPPLSDMFDGRSMAHGAGLAHEQHAAGHNLVMLPRGFHTVSPAPMLGHFHSDSRPPSLKTEQSSAGSMSSGSSYSSYPRTPVEGPGPNSVPIHALLTNSKQGGSSDSPYCANPAIYRSLSPDERAMSAQYPPERATNNTTPPAALMPLNGHYSGPPSTLPSVRQYFSYSGDNRRGPTPPYSSAQHQPPGRRPGPSPGLPTARPGPGGKSSTGLDGISALLQADRIVDRRQ